MTDLIPPAFTIGSQKLQRGRVRDAFPLLASLDSEDIVSLTDYLDERPQRFYSRSAMDAMATLLAEIQRDHPDILINFFRDHHEALKVAFRSAEEINRASIHDRRLDELGGVLRQLSVLDTTIHPAYLRLMESVLGTTILPVARYSRRRRKKDENSIPLTARIEELTTGPLGPSLAPFERVMRNAIAHGGIVFRDGKIEYRDSKQTVPHSVAAAFAQFDRALDVCNAFLLAYRLFFVSAADFFDRHALAIPLPVLIRELRAQVESASWSIEGALETAYADDTPGLRIFTNGRFRDVIKMYEATTRTAAVAERLAPSFTTYEVTVDRFSQPSGVGAFSGERLHELRHAGVRSLGDIAAEAAPNALVILNPAPRKPWPNAIRIAGFWIEAVRSLRGRIVPKRRPFVRFSRIHRKAHYLQVDATIVLQIEDRDEAKAFVRRYRRSLINMAIRHARRRSGTWFWRFVPIGFVNLDFFLLDARPRDLHGLGKNYLGQLLERRLGRIEVPLLHKATTEPVPRGRIDWNTMPFGDDGTDVK